MILSEDYFGGWKTAGKNFVVVFNRPDLLRNHVIQRDRGVLFVIESTSQLTLPADQIFAHQLFSISLQFLTVMS